MRVPLPPDAAPAELLPAQLAPVFFALGDVTRLRLVGLLCAGDSASITRLTDGTGLTRQAVTKHLEVLAEAGLVRDHKVGRERHWQFDPARIELARQSLDRIGAQWDLALGRLKAILEG